MSAAASAVMHAKLGTILGTLGEPSTSQNPKTFNYETLNLFILLEPR